MMNEIERETTQYSLQKKAERNDELSRRLSRARSREDMLRLFDELDSMFEQEADMPVA